MHELIRAFSFEIWCAYNMWLCSVHRGLVLSDSWEDSRAHCSEGAGQLQRGAHYRCLLWCGWQCHSVCPHWEKRYGCLSYCHRTMSAQSYHANFHMLVSLVLRTHLKIFF